MAGYIYIQSLEKLKPTADDVLLFKCQQESNSVLVFK
jgi:hypothetical protein